MSQTLSLLLQLLRDDPENWQLRRLAAEALAKEAATLVADTPVVPPTEADLFFAIDLLASTDPEQASAFANQVLEVDGDNPDAHVGKAFACWLGGDPETAHAWYQQAQRLQPGFRSGIFEKLIAESGKPAAEAAVGPGDEALAVVPIQHPDTSVNEPPPAQPPQAQAAGSVPFSAATPLIAVAQAVFPPTAAAAPAIPPPLVPVPAATAAEPAPVVSAEEQAALEATEQDAYLAGLIAHAAKSEDTKEKTTALSVAVVIHLVLFALLTLLIVAPALSPAPEIVAVMAQVSSETELQTRQVAPVVQRTPAAPSAPATQIINAAGMSSVSMSSVDFVPELDTIDFGSSIGSGFGIGGMGAGMGGGGMPFAMKSRCSRPERVALLAKHGGTVEVETAVERSLDWLQSQQNSNGSWGRGRYKAGMTGFALLCYLGRCETPDSVKYGDTVMNGIMYLVELSSKNNGMFTENPGDGHFVYEHGIATYAMGETYAMARMGNRRLPGVREAFERGVRIIVEGQTPRGGWVYHYRGGGGDTSVTGWQYQALRAAQTTQLPFRGLNGAIQNAGKYLESMQGPRGGFGYRNPEDKASLAGLGALGLQMTGGGGAAPTRKAIEFISNQPALSWSNIQIYPWYYNTQALFNAGGSDWQKWNKQMLPILLDNQRRNGSWPPMGTSTSGARHGHVGPDAEIYMTTMCTLMLEIYYRYLPAGSDFGPGGRGGTGILPEFKSRFD